MKQTFAKNISAAAIIIAACAITACSNSSGSVPFLPSAVGINSGTGTGQGGGNDGGSNGGQQNGGQQNEERPISLGEGYNRSMAVGEEVFLDEIMDTSQLAMYDFDLVSGADYVRVFKQYTDYDWDTGGRVVIKGLEAGTAKVKFKFFNKDDTSKLYEATVTFNVASGNSGGGSQAGSQDTATNEGLRNYLVGTWTCSDNGFSGVITLNSDGSGHIDVKRSNGDIIHNRDFTWTACVGMMASKILEISGTNEGALDGEHSITTSADSFTLIGWLAFGMSSKTTWNRQ